MRRFARLVLVFAVCSSVSWLAACGNEPDEPLSNGASAGRSSPPNEVSPRSASEFAPSRDVMCEWVTADAVSDFVAQVYGWRPTSAEVSRTGLDDRLCQWELSDATHLFFLTADVGFLSADVEIGDHVLDYADAQVPLRGRSPVVSGHPSLTAPTLVKRTGGAGVYVFWVPPGEDHLALCLVRNIKPGALDENTSPQAQARLFALADLMLRHLGWIPAG